MSDIDKKYQDNEYSFEPFTKLPPNRPAMKPEGDFAEICMELRDLQRKHWWYQRGRVKIENVLVSTVARERGYNPIEQDKEERKRRFEEAKKLIKDICAGEQIDFDAHLLEIVVRSAEGRDSYGRNENRYMNQMRAHVKHLAKNEIPGLTEFIEDSDQKGFGWDALAVLAGESPDGNIGKFHGPASMWKWFGCWPYTKNGQTRMVSTWARFYKKEITNDEWKYVLKYSRRRHALAWGVGKSLNMANYANPQNIYRARYLQAKREVIENRPHWHWNECSCCKAKKTLPKPDCHKCFGTGRVSQQANWHGITLTAKLLMKRLWRVWTGNHDDPWRDGQVSVPPEDLPPKGYTSVEPKVKKKKTTEKKTKKKTTKSTTGR